MLRLAHEGRGFKESIFQSALMDCQFVAYPVDTWQAATQQHAPLFSQQWAASQTHSDLATQASQVWSRRIVSMSGSLCCPSYDWKEDSTLL